MGHWLQTDFLFARPSWLSGFARILDLFGTFDSYNESSNGAEADARAMYADWRIVGQDIMSAVGRFQKENPFLEVNSLLLRDSKPS